MEYRIYLKLAIKAGLMEQVHCDGELATCQIPISLQLFMLHNITETSQH
jgi:hypothetical protein